jgi:hypothetical protein
MAINGFTGDFELSLGSIVGVRAFALDYLGRLVGVTKTDKVFKPGVNLADCSRCRLNRLATCECGFYAYFSGQDNKHMQGNPVGAIIEGTGKTVIGTKGFRTEKAELLALFPLRKRGNSDKPKPIARFTRYLYPSARWFAQTNTNDTMGYWGFGSFALTVILAIFTFFMLFASGITLDIVGAVAMVYVGGFLRRMTYVGQAGQDQGLAMICRTPKKYVVPVVDPFDRLRELYPDVPIYKSLKEAVKKHPLSTAEEHIPDPVLPSPATEDNFWELSTTPRKSSYVR